MRRGTIAERLVDYALALKYEDLPGEAVHEAKRRLVDSFACMLGGYEAPPAKAAMRAAPVVTNGLASTIFGSPLPTTPEAAAFANGILVRYLDFNDTYLSKEPAHPSDNIPAALAAAQAANAGGKELITAIVAAYEVQCRLCDAATLRTRGWDHVAYGAFSATVAASMLLGLSRDEFINAINIAGTVSPALRQSRAGELSMWKGCAFANTSKDALFASIMAKNGITGPAPIFEGEFGFEKTVSGPLGLSETFGGEGGERFKIRCPLNPVKDPDWYPITPLYSLLNRGSQTRNVVVGFLKLVDSSIVIVIRVNPVEANTGLKHVDHRETPEGKRLLE